MYTARDTRRTIMFAVVFKDEDPGEYRIVLYNGSEVSRMYDEQDFASFEDLGVTGIYAPGKDGSLQPVHAGEPSRAVTEEELPFRYAWAPLLTADGTVAGRVTYTDH
jgi:hypothetical protein